MEMQSDNAALLDAGQEEINSWALLEIFGHQKIAGRLTTRKLGTEVMFQVDVPKGSDQFSHSELFSPKSIFSIKPTTEEWCRKWAEYARTYNKQLLPYIPETRQLVAQNDNQQIDPDYVED